MSAARRARRTPARCRGWSNWRTRAGIPQDAAAPLLAPGVDFVLEGLYATKKISRSEERGYHGAEPPVRRPAREAPMAERGAADAAGAKGKKYYN